MKSFAGSSANLFIGFSPPAEAVFLPEKLLISPLSAG